MIRKHPRSAIVHVELHHLTTTAFNVLPGDLIKHQRDDRLSGVVVAVEPNGWINFDGTMEDALTILWSCVPDGYGVQLVSMPIRVHPQFMVRQPLIDVKPMSPPVGQVFYLKYEYDKK